MDVTRAATSIQVRWRYVHKCLPDLLRLLRTIPTTNPEKLEPLRRRLQTTDCEGAVGSPGVLTVSRGRHPGSLHACVHREAPSFATFAAFGAAVREHNAGGKETPVRPFTLPDEKGAYAALAETFPGDARVELARARAAAAAGDDAAAADAFRRRRASDPRAAEGADDAHELGELEPAGRVGVDRGEPLVDLAVLRQALACDV